MEITKTITSIFMVPTLKIPGRELTKHGFLNGYIKDSQKITEYENENVIFLLFRPKDLVLFQAFLEQEYERTRAIIEDYDYPNGFVVVVYKLNPKYEEDFLLVRQGKYSKTSEAFQKEFSKTVTIKKGGIDSEEISLQYRIFHRTEELIKFWEDKFGVTFSEDQELWSGFDEETETLTEEKLKAYDKQRDSRPAY